MPASTSPYAKSTETNYKENSLNGNSEKPSPVIVKDSNVQPPPPTLSTSYSRKSSEVLYNCGCKTICSSTLHVDSNLRIFEHGILW